MKKTTLLLSFLYSTLIIGQNAQTRCEEKPYIEVIGTAEKLVNPDEIFIEFSIQEKFDKGGKISIDSQMEKLKSGLKSLNIPLTNLSILDADLDYTRIHLFRKESLTKNNYLLKVADSKLVENVFKMFQIIEIKDAYISKVSYSKIDSLKKEVKIIAIKAAKEKASYLLEAIGEKLGKPLIINEKTPAQNIPNNLLNISGVRDEGNTYFVDGIKNSKQEASNEVILFEKIKIQASYYIKYAIQ
jgi:hypothetical protein